jgi:hypothetical protein
MARIRNLISARSNGMQFLTVSSAVRSTVRGITVRQKHR